MTKCCTKRALCILKLTYYSKHTYKLPARRKKIANMEQFVNFKPLVNFCAFFTQFILCILKFFW